MTAEALNLIVQISREPGGKRKITHITAVDGIDPVTQQIRLCDIFTYDRQSDTFNAVNPPPNYIIKKFNERKLTFDRNIFRG
jgi:hypothetical protein